MEQVINYYNDLIKDLDRLIKRLEDLGIEEIKIVYTIWH